MEHEVLWTPSRERIERAAVTRFQRWLETERGVATGSYEELWRWSVDDVEGFWRSIVEFFELRFEVPSDRVLDSFEMPGARWFPGSRVSYCEHIFRRRDPDTVALQHASELRESGSWSWGRLEAEAAAIAGGLRRLGVGPGDRVAAYMPNIPETVAAFLACASIGAVWSSAAPEFGARSVADRFSQIEPMVLLAIDGYRYGGRDLTARRSSTRSPRRCRRPRAWCVSHISVARAGSPGSWIPMRRCRARRCRLSIRCGCCTARERRACRSRSFTARAGFSWSRSRNRICISMRRRETGSSGSPRPAG